MKPNFKLFSIAFLIMGGLLTTLSSITLLLELDMLPQLFSLTGLTFIGTSMILFVAHNLQYANQINQKNLTDNEDYF